MASYNLDAIKAALSKNDKTSTGTKGTTQKQVYWKPTLGEHDLRFLPIQNSSNEPFQTVSYYGDPLTQMRMVAPYSFGLPDPIKEQFEELRNSKKHPDGWSIAKHLRAKERFYAVILVRGEEDKGPQIWEFSKETRDQVYGILTHKDNIDEDMLSPDVGYDFTCSVTQVIEGGKPRLYKGSPVKQINLQARKKPSPLSKDKAQTKKWLDAVPNLEEMFKRQCKSPEELVEVLEQFVANLTGVTPSASTREAGTDVTEAKTGRKQTNPVADKLEDAFADLAPF
jgi:hypothetical protein